MRDKLLPGDKELDARNVSLRLSAPVRTAFRSLAVAVRSSEHVDPDMYEVLQKWSREEPVTIREFITALPLIAEQMQEHVSARNDQAVKDAWRELCTQLPEGGFTLMQSKARSR